MLTALKRKFGKAVHHLRNPIGPDVLRRAIGEALGGGAELLFVHTSLSSCGWFTAGPRDVLSALRDASGTLAFPTHTYCYPEKPGEPGPVFDPGRTPSQNGILTELFRQQQSSLRSINATHSVAAHGPRAAVLTAGHYLADTPCGAATPYLRLVDWKGSVLMFGVSFHSYTLYHTAEDASGSRFAYEPETRDRLRVVDERGGILECVARRQTRNPRRFAECGALLEKLGLARRVELGANALLCVPDCAKVHDFLVGRLREVPDFLFASCVAPLA